VIFDTTGLARWGIIGANLASESGSNAGSDFALSRYNDAGNYVDSPLLASRASGIVTLAQRPVFVDKTPWDNGNLANPMTLDTAQTVTGAKTFSQGISAPNVVGKNKLINGNFAINQRAYATGTATTGANQYTLDRWRVVTSGQSLAFSASGNGNQVTAPAGGVEQVVEGNNIEGGTYTLSWAGTATATVNGTAVANGATIALTAATNATVRFTGGTVSKAQLELGTVATPFDMRLYPVELALCQRYYQTVFFDYTAYGTTGSNMTCGTVLPVPLRATGTATYVSSANLTNAGTPSVFANGSNRFTMGVTVTATGMMQALGVQWTLNAEL
jgi:hypothetical protein